MSMIDCHECKKQISSESTTCPNCGAPTKSKENNNYALGDWLVWGIFGGIFFYKVISDSIILAAIVAILGPIGFFGTLIAYLIRAW
ncbi:MAG: hypothetical protein U1E84_01285 [Rhodoferax sp.]